MRAEIVAVGTELLLGQIANTNARWMSESLAAIGVDVLHHQAVGDNLERIVEAMRLASSRAEVVVVTGGLGPTQDDITRDALGVLLGRRWCAIRSSRRCSGRSSGPSAGARCPRATSARPTYPEGARYIRPDRGTAPGLVAELPGGARIYAVPGVPEEMVEMMEGTILPELASAAGEAWSALACSGARGSVSRRSPSGSTTSSPGRRTRRSRSWRPPAR